MISATWDWLWVKHDQVKDIFHFFVRPIETMDKKSEKKTGQEPQLNGNNDDSGNGSSNKRAYKPIQLIGLVLGSLLFFFTLFFVSPEGLSDEGVSILATTIWLAIWWMTEAIPIPATALLPVILFPMTGGMDISATTSAYGNDTIFLFLGGFILALAMERWNLHRRIAINIILIMGTNTDRIVLGFMVATSLHVDFQYHNSNDDGSNWTCNNLSSFRCIKK